MEDVLIFMPSLRRLLHHEDPDDPGRDGRDPGRPPGQDAAAHGALAALHVGGLPGHHTHAHALPGDCVGCYCVRCDCGDTVWGVNVLGVV